MKNNSKLLVLLMAGLIVTQSACAQMQETQSSSHHVSLVDCRNFHSANSIVIVDGHTKLIYDPRLDTRKDCLSK
jgi:predicted proteasome-type protease